MKKLVIVIVAIFMASISMASFDGEDGAAAGGVHDVFSSKTIITEGYGRAFLTGSSALIFKTPDVLPSIIDWYLDYLAMFKGGGERRPTCAKAERPIHVGIDGDDILLDTYYGCFSFENWLSFAANTILDEMQTTWNLTAEEHKMIHYAGSGTSIAYKEWLIFYISGHNIDDFYWWFSY